MGMSQHNSTNENSEERDVMTRYNWSVQKNPPIIRYYLLLSVIYRIYIDCMICLFQKWIHSESIKMWLVCVYCSTSPRASQRQSVWSATELRVQATTQAAECLPTPTTLPLPHMLPGTPATHAHTHTQTQMGMYIRSSTFYIPNFPLQKMSFSC